MKSFGSYIRELRHKANWSQRKLAHELDMDVAVLSKIENENRFPRKKATFIIERLSMIFEIPCDQIKQIYLSDEIASLLLYENNYKKILEISEEKISYERSKKKI